MEHIFKYSLPLMHSVLILTHWTVSKLLGLVLLMLGEYCLHEWAKFIIVWGPGKSFTNDKVIKEKYKEKNRIRYFHWI